MVDYRIHDDPNAMCVGGFYHFSYICRGAYPLIDGGPVFGPVAMKTV